VLRRPPSYSEAWVLLAAGCKPAILDAHPLSQVEVRRHPAEVDASVFWDRVGVGNTTASRSGC
jgi:hypothetical protein